MALSSQSAVPGAAVPGMAVPGLDGKGGGTALYPYYGQVPLDYLDYVDASSGHTLVATPGGSYLMLVVNSRAGLTVPPPDGRWTLGGMMMGARAPLAAVLSAAEIAAARERSLAGHGHYASRSCPHCAPEPRKTPPELPATGRTLAPHGHYPETGCVQCDPAPAIPAALIRRVSGPDFAPAPPAPPPMTAGEALAVHGHYPGSACVHCVPARTAAPPAAVRGDVHGHYPGGACRQCDPVRTAVTPAPAAENPHGHYPGSTCRQCDPAPPEPVTRKAGGTAPVPSMAEIRSAMARSPLIHGHDTPCRCEHCGQAAAKGMVV